MVECLPVCSRSYIQSLLISSTEQKNKEGRREGEGMEERKGYKSSFPKGHILRYVGVS